MCWTSRIDKLQWNELGLKIFGCHKWTRNYGSLLVTWYKKYFSARNIFFRKKYFSPQEIYFSPQEIYFSPQEIYFSPQEIYFFPQEIFFSARNIFFRKKYFSPQEIYFFRKKIYFFRKKYIFPQEINFSPQEIFFSARNIFYSDWPSWLHNHLLSPAQTPKANGRQQQCPSLSFIRYRPAGPATSLSSRPAWKVPGPINCFVTRAVANV